MALTVIGGSNFLGRFLIRSLAEKYTEIRLGDMYPFRDSVYRLQEEISTPIVKHPLLYPTNLRLALDGAQDVIILTHDYFKLAHSKLFFVERTVDFAKKFGVKRLYWVAPMELNQLNKLDGDPHELIKKTESYVEKTFPEISILKTNLIFGKNCMSLVMQEALRNIEEDQTVISNNNGHSKFNPVYEGDLLHAFQKLEPGDRAKLAGPEKLHWRNICQILAEHVGKPEPTHNTSIKQWLATCNYTGDLFYPSHLQQFYRLLDKDGVTQATETGQTKMSEVLKPKEYQPFPPIHTHRVVID